MKKLFILLLFIASSALANPIDISCPHLTFKAAPLINADQYVCHKQYALAYSWASRNPIYTTEFLAKDHTGDVERTNDFKVDPAIDPHHSAQLSDYKKSICNGGRCDRGHMTPNQDFTACEVCVHESFYLSNMIPQNYKNNEVIWKKLEMKIRKYVAKHPDGVYVITGPSYKSISPNTIGKNKVWVPDMIWKIMIDAKTGRSIAFMMPNADVQDLSKFVVNIAMIEAATGIKFNSTLDKTTVANYQQWNLQTK